MPLTPGRGARSEIAPMRRPRRSSSALRLGLALALGVLVAGCASSPPRGTSTGAARPVSPPAPRGAGGAGASPPADLASVADAEPRIEPIRRGGPNKPYQALGRDYAPSVADAPFAERGLASWYGRKFHGQRTSSGEVYDMYAMTAAHPTLPIPSYARVRNPANGRAVIVRINDRGPFHPGRIVDLSYVAALKLDLLRGVAPVELERITFDEIRSGAWRREGDATPRLASSRTGMAVAAPVATGAPVALAAPDASPAAPVSPVAVASPLAFASPIATLAPDAPAPGDIESFPPTPPSGAAADPAASVRPSSEAGRGFWIQLGAFRERDGAQSFQRHVGADNDAGWLAPWLATFADASLFRVQAGPYPSRDEAAAAATRVRSSLGIVPMIVERR
jgi:rare lipoprotein A